MKLTIYLFSFLLLCFSCKEQRTEKNIFEALAKNDEKLSEPNYGEWRQAHPENGQTLEQYIASKPICPNDTQQIIYLQPIGNFDVLQNSLINYTSEYLSIFYDIKVVILPSISDAIVPDSAQRENGSAQLMAKYIMYDVLKPNMPKDAILTMAITEKDIYPDSSWNFVFGLSSLNQRVGVTSMYRLCDKKLLTDQFELCLKRLIKTSSREIGHMFSMRHCKHAVCTMNGSNSMQESDAVPNRLCSQCLAKLSWNLKFDNMKRLHKLQAFFKKYHLTNDYDRITADIGLLK